MNADEAYRRVVEIERKQLDNLIEQRISWRNLYCYWLEHIYPENKKYLEENKYIVRYEKYKTKYGVANRTFISWDPNYVEVKPTPPDGKAIKEGTDYSWFKKMFCKGK